MQEDLSRIGPAATCPLVVARLFYAAVALKTEYEITFFNLISGNENGKSGHLSTTRIWREQGSPPAGFFLFETGLKKWGL